MDRATAERPQSGSAEDAEKPSFEGHIEWPDELVKSLESTATFAGDDRIDWKSKFTLPGTDKVRPLTGHYARM